MKRTTISLLVGFICEYWNHPEILFSAQFTNSSKEQSNGVRG